MTARGLFIDSELFLLLVVGRTGREIVAKHKRLQEFAVEDYDLLLSLVGPAKQVFVTPHTLAETSNLLSKHAEPERSQLFDKLRHLIHESKEVTVAGTEASNNVAFKRLGLTDAALLEVATPKTPLLTRDLELYLEAVKIEPDSAWNFNHIRDL